MRSEQTRLPGEGALSLSRWGVVPALAYTVLCFAAPIVIMILVSFWQREGAKILPEWTFANYLEFFGKSYLVESLGNSVVVSLLTTVISVIVAYPLAYILAYQVPPRWQRHLLVLAVLPFWTSYVIRSYSWLLLLSDNGFINVVLQDIGLIDAPVQFAYNRGATILGFVHFFTMLLTLTIYANLVQISRSYRLAGADLGASKLQIFLRITLPLSLPGVAVGAFITFVIAIGDYITPQILGGSKEMLVPQAIILQVQRAANLPMASVMSLTLMAVVTLTYLLCSRYLKMERV